MIISLLCVGLMAFGTGCGSKEETTEIDSGFKSKMISLGDYKGITYEQMDTVVSDEEVKEEMSNELYEHGEYTAIDKVKVEQGDTVNISFEGTINGEEFEGGSEESYDLEIGSGEMIEGFEEGIVGADVGSSVELDLEFPDDYYETEMAGKAVHFKVTVNQIEEYKEPELTDAFVKEKMEYESVDDFEKQIRAMLEENKQLEAAEAAQYEIIEKIVSTSEFQMDEQEVADLADSIEEEYKEYADMYGMEFADFLSIFMGQTEEEFQASKVDYAKEQIQFELVLQEIAHKEKLGITDSDYEKQITSLVEEYGYESREALEADYDKDSIMKDMISDMVYNFLIEKGKAEKPSSSKKETGEELFDETQLDDGEEIIPEEPEEIEVE